MLEFYVKTGTVRKKFNPQGTMAAHRMKLDEGSISAALTTKVAEGGKRLQLLHATKGTFTLLSQSAETLEQWAAAVGSQIPRSRSVLKEGMLTKQGGGKSKVLHRSNWKQRWFQLERGTMRYFVNKGGEQKGEICLKTALKVRHADFGCSECNPSDTSTCRALSRACAYAI